MTISIFGRVLQGSKFNMKLGVERGKNSCDTHWGEILDNDNHLSLEEKQVTKIIDIWAKLISLMPQT